MKRIAGGLSLALFGVLAGVLGGGAETPSSGSGAELVDVTDGSLYDGWGKEAVRSLSIYYSAGGNAEMLGFRSAFLPVFDWANGAIETAAGGDLYSFYASGEGAGRTQSANDPAYVFRYASRYQEPAGRLQVAAAPGYALSLAASQRRTVNSDYQNWSEASLGTASGIDIAALQNTFNTNSGSEGFGSNLTRFTQGVIDTGGVTDLSRQAWQATGSETVSNLWSGRNRSFNSPVPSSLTPPTGVSGPVAAVSQRLLGNYFSGQSGFARTAIESDVLAQWVFAYDPNLAGASHVFRDDAGRVRLFRANPDLTNMTSQGFRYMKYDQWSRVTEVGVLLNVAKSSFDDYASWARQADIDSQLTSSNSCPVFIVSYDADPATKTISAYDERRGTIAKRSYYPTAIPDQPTSCPGREVSDPVNESLFQYDDLRRTMLLSEHRQSTADDIYRTTGRSWPNGGLITQLTFPDQDQAQAFDAGGQGSMVEWPDILGRTMRFCAGQDCSGVVYSDITGIDWTSSALSRLAGNGVGDAYSYDLRGATLNQTTSINDNVLFSESLRDMQISDGENPCTGSAASPNYSTGLLIARALSGSALPQEDQGVWDCYSYDGARRLTQSSRYQTEGQAWMQSSSLGYALDDNGNVQSITGTAPARFTRSGKDQLASASLASGDVFSFAYDDSHGQMTGMSSGPSGYSLSLEAEPLLHLPLSQTIVDNATGATLLTAAIDYEANGLRSTRTVRPGSQGAGSSTTSYWYGGGLNPLVVERDGVNYRLIGKSVVEQGAGDALMRSYLHADHLGSTRVITDEQGDTLESLGYDGDWGLTRITGQTSAASYDDMASFYRYQGQEQEIFPLTKLGISDSALAAWLDQVELYHFPWRDYAAGLATFQQIDPIPAEDSLYRAFGSNPVNFTDPTGGMIEDSKNADEDNENEQAQVQRLLDRITLNPEIPFTREEHQLLEKTYFAGRDVIVAEIQKHNALHIAVTNLLKNAYATADAAADPEEWKVLIIDAYYFEKWHDDVSRELENAEQKLAKFDEENASLSEMLRWSAFLLAVWPDEEESDDDDVATDLLQSMTTAPAPQGFSTEAASATREDSPIEHSETEEEEEKAEYEMKGQDHEKGSELP
jgi:hypothetical protein